MKDISGRLFQGKTHLRSVLRHSWKKDKCLPSSEEIMPIFPTKSNQESLKATINSAKTKVITTANKKEIYIYIYRSEPIRIHSNCVKRGKMRLTKLRLVLVLNLIGLESGVSFLHQS